MDFFTYSTLLSTYEGFADPIAVVTVNESDVRDNKGGFAVSDIEIDMTCGFDAGQAAFSYFDCYDMIKGQFQYAKIKNYITLGSPVSIALGYDLTARDVFRGIIVRVEFIVDDYSAPHVRVTAMDVKSIMMANHYHKRLLADSYSGAVKEIFTQSVYTGLIGPTNVITKLDINATPDTLDVPSGTDTDKTIEMVGESDYEFVVRAAKKYNYEFYCIAGQVIFRTAKGDPTTLLTFGKETRVFNMNISYDITGLVGKVVVRGLDVGTAKAVEGSQMNNSKISTKPSAKSLITGSEYVYVDPTVTSKIEAQRRSEYIFEDRAYRYGTLDMEIMGLPEVIPGRYIELKDFGGVVENVFYVTEVHHKLDTTGRFTSRIIGHCKTLPMMIM